MSLPDFVPEPEPDSVECRPDRSQWGGVWALLFMAAMVVGMYFAPDSPNRRGAPTPEQDHLAKLLVLGSLLALLLAGAASFALYLRRAFIIADSQGLRWRGAFRERRARWEDVSDYYFVRASSSGNRVMYFVEASTGRLSFGREWSSDRELALFIERHATRNASGAPGAPGGWREKERPQPRHEWPLRLGYRSFDNRFLMPALSLLCLGCVAAVDWHVLSAMTKPGSAGWLGVMVMGSVTLGEIVNLYGWGFAFLMGVFFGLLFQAVPAGMAALFFRIWLDAERRRDHRIEVGDEGIFWTDGSRMVASTWDEVRRIGRPREGVAFPARTMVQTDSGEFDFSHSLRGAASLLGLLRERAHNVPAEDWELNSRERRGATKDGDGLLFDYRNGSARFLVGCITAFLLLPVAMMWLRSVTSRADPDFLKGGVPWPLAVAGVALALWLWRLYYRANIRTDERGITQAGPFGTRFVAWTDVRKYLMSESGFVVEAQSSGGRRTTIRFQSCISGADELLDEIETKATRSQNRCWRHRLPPVGAESDCALGAASLGQGEPGRKYL